VSKLVILVDGSWLLVDGLLKEVGMGKEGVVGRADFR